METYFLLYEQTEQYLDTLTEILEISTKMLEIFTAMFEVQTEIVKFGFTLNPVNNITFLPLAFRAKNLSYKVNASKLLNF